MKEKKLLKKLKLSRKTFGIIFTVEILLGLVLFFIFVRMISLNTHDAINYVDSSNVDKIECADGKLIVNSVSVSVPKSDNISYDISYAWSENDGDYPTIPRAAIASYSNNSGALLFDISLYKDSFIPKAEIPEGKNAQNWFDDWKISDDGSEATYHESKKTDDLSGFLISSVRDADVEGLVLPVPESFYFAVSNDNGIYVYVLEGTLNESTAKDSLIKSMDYCMTSIKTTNSKKPDPDAADSENEVPEPNTENT